MEASPLIPERDASRHINLWRKVTGPLAPKVIDRLDEIQREVENMEVRRERSEGERERFKQCIRSICLDLNYAYGFDPHQRIGVHRGKSSLSRNPAYPEYVTARTFLAALNGLDAVGYLKVHSLGTEASSMTTRVSATQKLHAKLSVTGLTNSHMIDTDDVIRVNIAIGTNLNKCRVAFEETEQTQRWRSNLNAINQNIARFFIDLDFRNYRADLGKARLFTEREERETKLTIDFHSNRLYRVFNSLDFETGGRFYGGWWMNMKSNFRKFITISHKDTCEHDFSSIHPILLYAEKGVELAADYDPYSAPHGDKLRAAVKKAFNIMINGRRRPTIDMVPDFDPKNAGMSWAEFLDGILEAHKTIEDQFFTGAGTRLQRQDSDIAEAIMLEFANAGYPCLPIHDSFITFQTLDDEVPAIMRRAVMKLRGVEIHVKRKDSISYGDTEINDAPEMDIGTILESMSQREWEWYNLVDFSK